MKAFILIDTSPWLQVSAQVCSLYSSDKQLGHEGSRDDQPSNVRQGLPGSGEMAIISRN